MQDKIQAMRAYIDKTNIPKPLRKRYDATSSEIDALYRMVHRDPFGAIGLALLYGRAKGYRAAKVAAKEAEAMP